MRMLISFSQRLMLIFQDSGLAQVSSSEPAFLLQPVLIFYVIPRFCFRHHFSKTGSCHLISSHTMKICGNQNLEFQFLQRYFDTLAILNRFNKF